jgi:TRAP-type C4-dicarboxylate transport system substrate-binding protein
VQEEAGYLETIRKFGTTIVELSAADREKMFNAMGSVYKLAEQVIGKDLVDMALAEVRK